MAVCIIEPVSYPHVEKLGAANVRAIVQPGHGYAVKVGVMLHDKGFHDVLHAVKDLSCRKLLLSVGYKKPHSAFAVRPG